MDDRTEDSERGRKSETFQTDTGMVVTVPEAPGSEVDSSDSKQLQNADLQSSIETPPSASVPQLSHDKIQTQASTDSTVTFIQTSVPIIKNDNVLISFLKRKTDGLTKRQVYILVVFAFVEFFAATVISIQAPFFPDVAEKKGATAIEHGFVFAIFEIIVFSMSPIFGAKMGTFGPKRVFNLGIFTTGACCIIFGFLNHIEGRTAFIITCLIVRGIEAVGDAAFVTASFTVIALEFPESVATTFATMETFYGLGMIVGPTLGGALYEVGGYSLPFTLMGGLLFVSAVATYFLLPDVGKSPDSSKAEGTTLITASGFEMFTMLRIPVIAMIAYSILSTAGGVGFLSVALEPHLRQFQLNKFAIGAVFILKGGVYALTAPGWGWICDHTMHPKYITLAGSIFTIIGFSLIGPVPFLPFDTTLWAICIGLVLFGLGLGATLVSAFIQVLQDAIARGYPDDVRTYGLVSGLWTSMTALGFFIGSSIGGILLHHVGFQKGTTFVLAGQFLLVGFLFVFLYKKRKAKEADDFATKNDNKQVSNENRESVNFNNIVQLDHSASNPAFRTEEC